MLGAILAAAGLSSATAGNIGAPLVEVAARGVGTFSVSRSGCRTLELSAALHANPRADRRSSCSTSPPTISTGMGRWRPTRPTKPGSGDRPVARRSLSSQRRRLRESRAAWGSFGGDFGMGESDVRRASPSKDGFLVDHAFGGGRLLAVAELATPRFAQRRQCACRGGARPRVRNQRRCDRCGPDRLSARPAPQRACGHRRRGRVTSTTPKPPTPTLQPRASARIRRWSGSPEASTRGWSSTNWWPGPHPATRSRPDRHLRAERSPRRLPDTRRRSPWKRAASMDDAVEAAAGLARPGDTVLLAPAAASMDMFRDYAARGEAFRCSRPEALGGRVTALDTPGPLIARAPRSDPGLRQPPRAEQGGPRPGRGRSPG